jgi:hypothetical protein
MPTTGTKLYRFINGAWRAVYAELFDDAEKAKIRTAFDQALTDAGLADERIWGERIEDRGSQITFSGLGQAAPLKEAWDPDRRRGPRCRPRCARSCRSSRSISVARHRST